MGEDKAKIVVHGEPLAHRIARLLTEEGLRVTVCGREPIGGLPFIPDREEFAGPLAALAGFRPEDDVVFVASCDLPGFDASVIRLLASRLDSHEACIPALGGRLQPLCALYRSSALGKARELAEAGEKRIMRWIDRLDHIIVDDLDPSWIANVNTPDDLRTSLGEHSPVRPGEGS